VVRKGIASIGGATDACEHVTTAFFFSVPSGLKRRDVKPADRLSHDAIGGKLAQPAVHPKTRELLHEPDAELVFGLTAAVGADVDDFVRILEKLLRLYAYTTATVRLSALLDKVDPAWLRARAEITESITTHGSRGAIL
jgi:hypothetical protein